MRVAIAIALTLLVFPAQDRCLGESGIDPVSVNDSISGARLDNCGRAPLVVVSISRHYDGGSMAAAVTDSNGCLVEFIIDHGMGSATPGALYVGARAVSSPSARIAGLAEKKYVLQLVVQVLESNCGKEFPAELRRLIEKYERDAEGTVLIERLLGLLKGC